MRTSTLRQARSRVLLFQITPILSNRECVGLNLRLNLVNTGCASDTDRWDTVNNRATANCNDCMLARLYRVARATSTSSAISRSTWCIQQLLPTRLHSPLRPAPFLGSYLALKSFTMADSFLDDSIFEDGDASDFAPLSKPAVMVRHRIRLKPSSIEEHGFTYKENPH